MATAALGSLSGLARERARALLEGGMEARLVQRLHGVRRRPGRGRWRLGERRRARLAWWLSTEQLGGAGEVDDRGEGC